MTLPHDVSEEGYQEKENKKFAMVRNYKIKRVVFLTIVFAVLIYLFVSSLNWNGDPLMTSNEGSFIPPGQITRTFTFIDSIQYYRYSFTVFIRDYSWVVRIAFLILASCTLLVLSLAIRLSYFIYKKRKYTKENEKYIKKYAGVFSEMIHSHTTYSVDDMQDIMKDLRKSPFTRFEQVDEWVEFWIREVSRKGEYYNETNWNVLCEVVGFLSFSKRILLQGSTRERIRLLRSLEIMRSPLNEGYVVRLVNHKNPVLRKEARLFYIAVSNTDQYNVLDGQSMMYNIWNFIELHEIFKFNHAEGKKLPSFLALLDNTLAGSSRGFVLKEAAFWLRGYEMRKLLQDMEHQDSQVRDAVYRSIGINKYQEAEPNLIRAYERETELERRMILAVVYSLHTGRQTAFFKMAYRDTASFRTKLVALCCLRAYSRESQGEFKLMRDSASERERVLFGQVESMTNRPVANKTVTLAIDDAMPFMELELAQLKENWNKENIKDRKMKRFLEPLFVQQFQNTLDMFDDDDD